MSCSFSPQRPARAVPSSPNPEPTQSTVRAGPRSGAGGEGLEKASCRVCRASCNRPAEVRMLGGIRACLVPPAPNSAGKSLIGLRGRRSCTIRQSGLDPSAIPSSGRNSPRDKLIKPPYPGKEVQSDCRGFYFRRHSLHLALAEWKLPFCPNG